MTLQDTQTSTITTSKNRVEFTIQREALLNPLKSIIGVVDQRQVVPILGNIKLVAKDALLILTASDAKIELTSYAELNEPVEGIQEITLPGRKFMDICRALPENATIRLSTQQGWASIQSSNSQFKLTTLPASGFPSVNLDGEVTEFVLLQKALRYHLNRTQFAMAQQDVRYFLNGISLEVTSSYVRFVATDGHRLALNTLHQKTPITKMMQTIIPQKAVQELLRLLEDKDNKLTIYCTKNHIQIKSDELIFTANLIDGRYPPYQKVLPKNGDKKVLVNCEIFKQALKRATILTNERFRGVKLDIADDAIEILTYNPQQEASKEKIVANYKGEPISISFNLNYLLDVLNVIDSEEVRLTLSTPGASILLEEPDNKDSLFVIMPVTL